MLFAEYTGFGGRCANASALSAKNAAEETPDRPQADTIAKRGEAWRSVAKRSEASSPRTAGGETFTGKTRRLKPYSEHFSRQIPSPDSADATLTDSALDSEHSEGY